MAGQAFHDSPDSEEEQTVKGERRTSRKIRTLGALLDRRRARTSGGALLELASLAHERTRLRNELQRQNQRRAEIEIRLAEITAKEIWLRPFIEQSPGDGSSPLPVAEVPTGICVRELNY
jgi:hypothetical protein